MKNTIVLVETTFFMLMIWAFWEKMPTSVSAHEIFGIVADYGRFFAGLLVCVFVMGWFNYYHKERAARRQKFREMKAKQKNG